MEHMTITLTRRTFEELDFPQGFLRPQDPTDHRQFEEILPWMTPRFVYRWRGAEWVRWAVPAATAKRLGLDEGCVCCGTKPEPLDTEGGLWIDTAWHETSFWLEANGYALPDATSAGNNTEGDSAS